jgi:glutamyl-tRNA synthetase
MPRDGSTTFTDLLRGDITVENAQLDDFVILKSDGFPTYHLASVVDDHEMAITHVTRGEEWIPSAPRHVRLYDALGYAPPIFCHTPVILGADGGKLSKRHGAKSVLEYAEDGYLPEALFNFLAILGWAMDDHTEIFSREQLIEHFDISDLSHHPAVFDTNKLEWMNGIYMRSLPEDLIAERFAERLDRDLPAEVARPISRELVRRLTPLVRERVKLLPEVTEMVDFFFLPEAPHPDREALLGKRYRERAADAAMLLGAMASALAAEDPWDADSVEARLRSFADGSEEKTGDLFMLCRVAITGKPITPPLFETMAIVGRDGCLARLRSAAAALQRA